jgi:hypothetical protein
MTFRSLVIGTLLGLTVASVTYFNDQVIRQTMLAGHHLPPVVFGLVAMLMLGLHPLLRLRSRAGGFRPGEVAIIAAIALAACGWPGNSFYRCFAPVVSMPSHWGKTESHWIANDVFSFVPGATGEIAPEHVPDAAGLARLLRTAGDTPGTPAHHLWRHMGDEGRHLLVRMADAPVTTPDQRRRLASAVNTALADPGLYDPSSFTDVDLPTDLVALLAAGRRGELDAFDLVRANRVLLSLAMPEYIQPLPRGEGVLLEGGRADTQARELLLNGVPTDYALGLEQLPWKAWWPTLWFWGWLTVCLGIAALCLALIVHPQWSRRELLPYPIPRVIQEVARTTPGGRLPQIARCRGFWLALGGVASIHLLNGLHAYYPTLPNVALTLDFNALRELFPNASRVFGSSAYFQPRIFPSVVAFAMFLTASVSFSLGIAQLLFITLGALLVAQGIAFDRDYLGGSKINMMTAGSFFAMVCIILYVGRRYYAGVLAGMAGLTRDDAVPAYTRWAGWGLVFSLCGAVLMLYRGGLSIPLGVTLVAFIMILWLVMSRVSAETGMFLIKPAWLPVGLITSLLGFEAIGPTAYIVMAIVTIIIVGEAREAIMPYLTNGLRLAEQNQPHAAGRIAPWLMAMIVLSLLVGGAVSLLIQHNIGLSHGDVFATHDQPSRPFHELARLISTARAHGSMDAAVTASGWDRLMLVQPGREAVGWLGLGFLFVMVTASARLRLPWWPLHPVIFLVWGTMPMLHFSFSLLLGWLVRVAVVGSGGARLYHAALPIAVGVILADVLSALGWCAVGAIYYFTTNASPPLYRIFPG